MLPTQFTADREGSMLRQAIRMSRLTARAPHNLISFHKAACLEIGHDGGKPLFSWGYDPITGREASLGS